MRKSVGYGKSKDLILTATQARLFVMVVPARMKTQSQELQDSEVCA